MQLGQMTPAISGDITTLNAIIVGSMSQTEANLGFHPGRLSAGYKILLLKSVPLPHAFELSGTTLRSGGRAGLPAQTAQADAARARVHDDILSERGAKGYEALQMGALGVVQVTGPNRLVKVLPDIPHDGAMSPSEQYPMGGGFLQWKLKRPGLPFLYAARVDGSGRAQTPGDDLMLNGGGYQENLDGRTALHRYLSNA